MWRCLIPYDRFYNPHFHGRFSDKWLDDHVARHSGQRELYSPADLDVNLATWQMSTDEVIATVVKLFEILLHRDLQMYNLLDNLFTEGMLILLLTISHD